MNQLKEVILAYNAQIIMGLAIGMFILLILNIIAEFRISGIKKRYNEFTRGIKGLNIEELLIKTGEELHEIRIDMNITEQKIENIETRLSFAIQKLGIVRYNAFRDLGSDLSFSIALLDKFNNGFVLTSIYGRDFTTSYAKPIKFGKSSYPLSVEEIQAIDRAMMGENIEKTLK